MGQIDFLFGDLLQHRAGRQLRHRHAGMLDRQPDHRHQVGDHQDDVLADLGPRHRAHPAQERAHQHAAQGHEDAQLERDAGQAGGDDAHAVDLRHQVGERAQDGAEHPRQARQLAAVARAQVIGNGVLAEFAQIGRQQQRHQHIAARPAHDVGQPAVAGQVQRARHADERRHGHPVGRRRHAVVEGRHAPARDVVFDLVGSPAHDADAGVQADRHQQEHIADPAAGHAHELGQRQQQHQQDEAQRIQRVDTAQALFEFLGGIAGKGHQSSRRVRERASNRFMTSA
ncbi:Uncharacterised protein [Bordetella pertussis]|nr:Uncharacterised protein [Bordetella pertussis]CPP73930.1 Uncharacterised protein [Bordetella pertussis]